MMSEPIIRIRNNHTVACGDPPIINNDDPDVYVGYFENQLGEQWIFTYNRASHEAKLRGGDIGWNSLHDVADGTVADLNLNEQEMAWLAACWNAAVG